MIDANARTGQQDQSHIFVNDDDDNKNTPQFRDFLYCHNLCAPSTLSLHEGPHTTWIHPDDHSEFRIGYVLVPCDWVSSCTFSGWLDHLDPGHLGDHRLRSNGPLIPKCGRRNDLECDMIAMPLTRRIWPTFLQVTNHHHGAPTFRRKSSTSMTSSKTFYTRNVLFARRNGRRHSSLLTFGGYMSGN